jgi:drug/metabolite transporter (DMT)-like permease
MSDSAPGTARTRAVIPYAALGLGILALSLSSLFVRWSEAPGPVMSFYRMAIAAFVLLPVIAGRALHSRRVRVKTKEVHSGKPKLRWLLLAVAGGLFTALDHGTWSSSIAYTRVANATLLNNMAPVWVALFTALVWKEHLARRFWLGLVVTLGGAAVVLGVDMLLAPEMNLGNGLALLSSVFYAAYFLTTQRARSFLDTLTYIWLVDVFSTLGLLGISLALKMPLTGYSPLTWIIFFCAAFVSQLGGYFAIAYALGHLPAAVVSPSMVSQPVISALLAMPLAGELLAPAQWLGGLAVVGGIFLVNASQGEAKSKEAV